MLLPIAYEGEGRDGYRDQIVTCDVGVSLNSKTHPLFMKYSNGKHTVLCISLSELVSCAFSTIPICPFLIQIFTCYKEFKKLMCPRHLHYITTCSYIRISNNKHFVIVCFRVICKTLSICLPEIANGGGLINYNILTSQCFVVYKVAVYTVTSTTMSNCMICCMLFETHAVTKKFKRDI